MEKKKTAEQMAEEHTADNLLKYICSETFTRHASLSEEEFLKEIGFDKTGMNEEQAVRYGLYNVIVEKIKTLLLLKNEVANIQSILDICLLNGKKVEEVKGEENGK